MPKTDWPVGAKVWCPFLDIDSDFHREDYGTVFRYQSHKRLLWLKFSYTDKRDGRIVKMVAKFTESQIKEQGIELEAL